MGKTALERWTHGKEVVLVLLECSGEVTSHLLVVIMYEEARDQVMLETLVPPAKIWLPCLVQTCYQLVLKHVWCVCATSITMTFFF